ncbi:MAG: glucoamylase family protein [Gemmatimonadota bacterium]
MSAAAGPTPLEAAEIGKAARLASGQDVTDRSGSYRRFDRRVQALASGLARARDHLLTAATPVLETRGSEWLLDNFYLVREATTLVRRQLPRPFYNRLPTLREGALRGEPRVQAIAAHMIDGLGEPFSPESAADWLADYQTVKPLRLAELWALPTMLRFSALERLLAATHRLFGGAHVPAIDSRPSSELESLSDAVGRYVESLRVLSVVDWRSFVESSSLVHGTLDAEPAGVYGRSDFATRDRYRHAIEEMSVWGAREETELAGAAVDRSRRASREEERHVGAWLMDPDLRLGLEADLGIRAPARVRLGRFLANHAFALYMVGVAAVTLAVLLALVPTSLGRGWVPTALATVLAAIPASAVAVAVANAVTARIAAPRRLCKLHPARLPDHARTLVVTPVLIASPDDVHAALHQLEINYQGNSGALFSFALLTDFADADAQHLEGEAETLDVLREGVARLNRIYEAGTEGPFFALHRARTWNGVEDRWMGWERKRGKLVELNDRILGRPSSLEILEGSPGRLDAIRYVLTLDADTLLPKGTAARLVGALAHPLNRARFDEDGAVISGYTVLQPRVETAPPSARRTQFARLMQRGFGLDLYTHAASDVYQDLFGEGIFAGKGLYDVAAFQRSTEGRVPENAILSHDLLEGLFGRAGLISDVVVLENYPGRVSEYLDRLHRWVRGDWQLVPWLGRRVPSRSGQRVRSGFSGLDRWKIADNLRRSLTGSSLLLLLVAGWTVLPGSVERWTIVFFALFVAPAILSSLGSRTWGALLRRGSFRRPIWRSGFTGALRWGLNLALLPAQTVTEADAVARATTRVYITNRRRLEWVTSARMRHSTVRRGRKWAALAPGPALAVVGALASAGYGGAGLATLALLLLWTLSPAILKAASKEGRLPARDLDAHAQLQLRLLSRRTWRYFSRYLTPQDNWLPPDNVQEEPALVAHRTSPTNIGFGALSVLCGLDLGYTTPARAAATLSNLFDSLAGLERYRGHFLNWYSTQDLAPLEPRYVSTVDSGNLAASLLTLSRGLGDIPDSVVPRDAERRGLADSVRVLAEELTDAAEEGSLAVLEAWVRRLEVFADGVETWDQSAPWSATFAEVADELVPAIETDLVEAAEADPTALSATTLRRLRASLGETRELAEHCHRDAVLVAPWIDYPSQLPEAIRSAASGHVTDFHWADLTALAREPVSLRALPERARLVRAGLESLDQAMERAGVPPGHDGRSLIHSWKADAAGAEAAARDLLFRLDALATEAERLFAEMDFTFLYDPHREVFRIGYDVSAGLPDGSHYDLLASEARLASYIAIARGDVPGRHWVHLRRPFRRRGGTVSLVSWSGTAFEYLMPLLFLRLERWSLIELACRTAVEAQRAFGGRNGIPWGISESAYAQTDAFGTYQYRAFGVPDLGLAPDLGQRLVVAPYASVLAIDLDPAAVVDNLAALQAEGMMGECGLYDAIDYGSPKRRRGRPGRIVHTYMAHHQGMILAALDNHLTDGVIRRRFEDHPGVESAKFLLYEQVPPRAIVQAWPRPADTAGIRRARTRHAVVEWQPRSGESPPAAVVLGHGSFSELIGADGSGGLRWKGRALSRWRPVSAACPDGWWIYLKDLDTGEVWSPTSAPAPAEAMAGQGEVTFGPHGVWFHRRRGSISARLGITIAPGMALEIRRLTLTNESDSARRFMVVSYGDIALAEPAAERRHPSFNKMFIASEFDEPTKTVLFQRRDAARGGAAWLAHSAVPLSPDTSFRGFDTDRGSFLGRGGSARAPKGLHGDVALAGSWGDAIDPACVLAWELDLPAGEVREIGFLTAAGTERSTVLSLLERFRSPHRLNWAAERARDRSEEEFQELGAPPRLAEAFSSLLSALARPYHAGRRRVDESADDSRIGALWGLGLSGDSPLVLVRVGAESDVHEVLVALRAHVFLAGRQVRLDTVILDDASTGYSPPLKAALDRAAESIGLGSRLTRAGRVVHVQTSRIAPEQRRRLERAAAVTIDASRSVEGQLLALRAAPPAPLPPFVPARRPLGSAAEDGAAVAPREDLRFDNGLGGFAQDGREYVIRLEPGASTPAPWINVLANPRFGCTVSESGAGFTWAENSSESRLTPWFGDPVTDPTGESLYVRDEETGRVWSPMPAPAGVSAPYVVRHRWGSTVFEHGSHALDQSVTIWVDREESAKVIQVELRNLGDWPRRLTCTYYARWVLGSDPVWTAPHIRTRLDPDADAILAYQAWTPEAAGRVAFLGSTERVHGATADREEFLDDGGAARPAALSRLGLAGTFGAGLDPCGALQIHVDLGPGEAKRVAFVLGSAPDDRGARRVLNHFRRPGALRRSLEGVERFWAATLGRTTVQTPDESMNLMLNGWLAYQTLSSRLYGRAALYQPGGAFGFRDQLQDVLAFLLDEPRLARSQILLAAAQQFREGDVLHWWHPDTGRGVRTRCSDDLLWLPFVVSEYLSATGDRRILDERVPFLMGPELAEDEGDRYDLFPSTPEAHSVYEHCVRAIERGWTEGPRGLPLMGSGDWNDALDRVGAGGTGTSVWLGWFLYRVAGDFAPVCAARGDDGRARAWRRRRSRLAQALEAAAWDGAWYRRGFFDDGSPIGSTDGTEAQIDSLTQSWAVLSGGARPDRAKVALRAVKERLVRRADRLVLLLAPPFQRTVPDPGYIQDYPAGARENGGQYSHAAAWVGLALAELGDGQGAHEVFRALNPVVRAATPADAATYRVEPYVVAADVHSGAGRVGRGGWTWYTGAAAWLRRLGLEWILGLRPRAGHLHIDPCIPASWNGFSIVHKRDGTRWEIDVLNPEHVSRGVVSVHLDGAEVPAGGIPLTSDGGTHSVRVVLGRSPEDIVDLAAADSFPASDSPPWTLGTNRG